MSRRTGRYLFLIAVIFIAMAVIGPLLPQEWAYPLKHFLREFVRYVT